MAQSSYPHFFVEFFHTSSTHSTNATFHTKPHYNLIIKHFHIFGTFWHANCDIS